MAEISRDEAKAFFENFTKDWFSSFKFKATAHSFLFYPAPAAVWMLRIFYPVVLFAPHLISFFGTYSDDLSTNKLLYFFVTVISLIIFFMMVRFLKLNEIEIETSRREIKIKPVGPFSKFFHQTFFIRFDDVKEINHSKTTTKSATTIHINLITIEGKKHECFTVSNWNVAARIEASVFALIFGKADYIEDINDPLIVIDRKLNEMLNEKEAETSYLPMVMLLLTLLILIGGVFIYFVMGGDKSFIAEIDSLYAIKLKYWFISIFVFSIPLFVASRTSYQKRNKKSFKTFFVLGSIAAIGIYLAASGIVSWTNIHCDGSIPEKRYATVLEAYYSPRSGSSQGNFVVKLAIDGVDKHIFVNHHNKDFQRNLKETIEINVHEGYFRKRWIEVTQN
jgi:hypothetical protein